MLELVNHPHFNQCKKIEDRYKFKGGIKLDYSYPISIDWSTSEIVDVIKFFESIEKAYESGVKREVFMGGYRRFKEIVPSIAEEKKVFREFEEISGYSSYYVVKKAKESAQGTMIKMGKS